MSSDPYSTTASTSASGANLGVVLFFDLIIFVVAVAIMWKLFVKAGKPGWAAIIPIYNTLVLLEIAGRPWWWLLLLFIPIVNIVILFMLSLDIAKAFGKSTMFGVLGLFIFSVIGYAMLAFGSAKYVGAGAAAAPAGPAGPSGPAPMPPTTPPATPPSTPPPASV